MKLLTDAVKSGAWIEIHLSPFGYRASANWDNNFSVCGEGRKTIVKSLPELSKALKEYRKDWPPKQASI